MKSILRTFSGELGLATLLLVTAVAVDFAWVRPAESEVKRLSTHKKAVERTVMLALREQSRRVRASEPLAQYAYRVVTGTRDHPQLQLGASPRAAMSWLAVARARALLHGRDYVVPDDLKQLAVPVLAHRLFGRGDLPTSAILTELLDEVEVPL